VTLVKNAAIRAELAKVGMSMTRLAELKGISKQEMSIAINTAEWSVKERNETIQLIRDNAGRS
jgi:lambda repressor-like predicted transcriptional regulator